MENSQPQNPPQPPRSYFGPPIRSSIQESHQRIARFTKEIKEHRGADDIVAWIGQNRWIKGAPWSWSNPGGKIDAGEKDDPNPPVIRRDYLFAYLRDTSPEKSIEKPRQAEMSESTINEGAFYASTRPGTTISHIFPTDGMGDGFSEEKIQPALTESPRIQRLLTRSKIRRYLFHGGSIYSITGAMKKAAGRSGSRDILFFDELDWMAESIIPVFRDLISHSQLRLERYLSTPTVPGVGIDRVVQRGCGYEHVVTCPSCKTEQVMSWPDNVMNMFEAAPHELLTPEYEAKLNKAYIGCSKCGAYLDRNAEFYVENSRWIPQNSALIGIRASYYLTVFQLPWKTGKEVARQYHLLQNYLWQFVNDVIGKAYIKGSSRLTETDIVPCRENFVMPLFRTAAMSNVSMGVDWGEKDSWVIISARGYGFDLRRVIVYIERINETVLRGAGIDPQQPLAHAVRAAQLIEGFGVQCVVNDANGIGVDKHKFLVQKFPGRVWGSFFDTADSDRQLVSKDTRLLQPQFSKTQRRVTFSKLVFLKEVQNEFRMRLVAHPAPQGDRAEDIVLFEQHCKNLGIQPRWSIEHEREYEVVVKFGEDHLFDANMYSYLAYNFLAGAYKDGSSVTMV